MVIRSVPAMILALLLLALVGGNLRPVAAQLRPEGWIDVNVSTQQADGSMQALPDVTVLLADASGDQVATATTDNGGQARLEPAPGAYSLTLYRNGYDGAGSLACDGISVDSATNVRWGDYNAEQELNVQVALGKGICRQYEFTATPAPPSPPAPPPAANPVHLTFDDGYVYLCQTVDMVISLGVHATFFLTGQAIVTYPDCVRRLVAAGNQLANHSWAHENLTRLSRQQILSTLQRTEDAAQSVAGVSTRPFCRPPYGAINAFVRQVAAEWGCQMILWDRDTRDWAGLPASTITNTALSISCRGEIILMHTQAYPQERFAVPAIVAALRARGCEPVVF